MLLEWLLEVWKKLLPTLTKNTRISMTHGEGRDKNFREAACQSGYTMKSRKPMC